MYLKELSLINFKNYDEANLVLDTSLNVFSGNNGAGKTNLLDAIHYLSLCKSYFNPIDVQQIKHQQDFFFIQGKFLKNESDELISVALKRNQKKQFKRNKKEYSRLADHIGLFPLVMISPNDIALILDGSEERRKFIDNAICQIDNHYLDELIVYNKTLQNRNAVLKNAAEHKKAIDVSLLEIYDVQLVQSGQIIFEKRNTFIKQFIPIFNQYYQFISEGAEEVSLEYQSQLLHASFDSILKESFSKDRILHRTTAGIHKDEFSFHIEQMPLKKFGSQGQQKSFLIAMKLAQYAILDKNKGYKPLLLLDDIFDKLDDLRIGKLMKMVSDDDFGQIFISDTNHERVNAIFSEINKEPKIFKIKEGNILA